MLERTIYATTYAPPRIPRVQLTPTSQILLTVNWNAYCNQAGNSVSSVVWQLGYTASVSGAISLLSPTLTGNIASTQALCSGEGLNVVQCVATMSDGTIEIREFRVEGKYTVP